MADGSSWCGLQCGERRRRDDRPEPRPGEQHRAQADSPDAGALRQRDEARHAGGVQCFNQQVDIVQPREHVPIGVVRHLMDTGKPERVRPSEAASIRTERGNRHRGLSQLVEPNQVGEALRVCDLPMHVAQVADASCIDARALKLMNRRATGHLSFDIPEIVEARADCLSIGGAYQQIDIAPDTPRGIGVHVVRERRAFHQQHVHAARSNRGDEAPQLETQRQLHRRLAVGARSQTLEKRRGQMIRRAVPAGSVI